MCKITVFTPTYNRAYIISHAYDSLLKQTFKDFEWLIIDDGSTDNTEELILKYINDNIIDIRYYKKKNGGQHTALNKAIDKAKGDIFIILDSDDYLTSNALERIIYWENTISADKTNKWGGVSGLKVYPNGDTVGGEWNKKENYVDATNFQRAEMGLLGDKAEAYYTEILKKFYPIPVFENENDVEKAVLWNRIANAGYKIRWFNEGIYVCEYLEDGMSKNILKNHLKNFKGYTCWKKELIDMQHSYIRIIAETSAYVSTARKKGLSITKMAFALNRSPITVLLAEVYYLLHIFKENIINNRMNVKK